MISFCRFILAYTVVRDISHDSHPMEKEERIFRIDDFTALTSHVMPIRSDPIPQTNMVVKSYGASYYVQNAAITCCHDYDASSQKMYFRFI